MRYVTTSELSQMLRSNLWKIPHDIDLVVGIPRSGLMVANMVALYLNKRLSDIDSFVEGRIFNIGSTRAHMVTDTPIRKVLVVDDSVMSGSSLEDAKQKLRPLTNRYEFCCFAPIVTSTSSHMVDAYAEIIDDVRIFEWNLFHHSLLESACIDLDGVLCVDPPVDDDGEIYTNYILNATPLFIPTSTIGTIVTCRLEKYRSQTETWLKQNNIKYHNLVMLDMPSRDERIKWGRHGEYKADYYSQHNEILFIESSLRQATTIAQLSHKDVICIETNSLIKYEKQSLSTKIKRKFKQRMPKTFRLAKQTLHFLKKMAKH